MGAEPHQADGEAPEAISGDDAAGQRRGLLYVAIAVTFFSTSPVLIRWAAETLTAYEITAGRMICAAALIVIVALSRGQRMPGAREWPRFAGYGLIAALHFALYIASLEYTTIAHSLALVYTAPIFVALFSRIYLHEDLTQRQWFGTLVAILGVVILTGFEPTMSRRMLLGDALAVGSAICFGLYSVAGRSQRYRYPLFAYAGAVYAAASLWLLPAALWNFSPDGYTTKAVVSVVLLGLLPLGLGHTLYNAALRLTQATKVNLIATQEVTGGIILGAIFLQEFPGPSTITGALITLAGIILVII